MIPRMPDNFKGTTLKKTKYILNTPRKWTNEEINWVKDLKEKGYSIKDISESIERDLVSTSIKLKRLQKKDKNYNSKNINLKYSENLNFFNLIKPLSVLDLYAANSWYKDKIEVITNDKDSQFNCNFNLDALKCLTKLYSENYKFDLIDLDPFGSAFDCFDLSIKMAEKGLIITFGEFGHRRFRRLDFVQYRYDIYDFENFKKENMIKKVLNIGLSNKKKLNEISTIQYGNIFRTYFQIEKIKITSQWGEKNDDLS